jgi:membrane protein required for colicin V production
VNGLDIAILIVLGVLLLKGLWLGLVQQLCSLAGLALGALLAVRYQASLAEALPAWLSLHPLLASVLSSTLLFLATLVFFILLGLVLSRLLKLVLLGGFNRVLGGLFGLVEGTLLLCLLLYGLSLTDWFKASQQASRLAPPFVTLGGQMVDGGRQLLQ